MTDNILTKYPALGFIYGEKPQISFSHFNKLFSKCIFRLISFWSSEQLKITMIKHLFILFSIFGLYTTQRYSPMFGFEKQGACPQSSGTCSVWCRSDIDCPGDYKCCGTNCGGRLCLPPARIDDKEIGEFFLISYIEIN